MSTRQGNTWPGSARQGSTWPGSARDSTRGIAQSLPAHERSARAAVRERGAAKSLTRVPRMPQPLGGRVGAIWRRVEVGRRVRAAIVALVERPFANGVESLGPACECVLNAVCVVEDVRVHMEVLARARVGVRLDLEGGYDPMTNPMRGRGNGIPPHLKHPILDEASRHRVAAQLVRVLEPTRCHLLKVAQSDE